MLFVTTITLIRMRMELRNQWVILHLYSMQSKLCRLSVKPFNPIYIAHEPFNKHSSSFEHDVCLQNIILHTVQNGILLNPLRQHDDYRSQQAYLHHDSNLILYDNSLLPNHLKLQLLSNLHKSYQQSLWMEVVPTALNLLTN